MVIKVKYLFFVLLLGSAFFIAFRAGEKGVRESRRNKAPVTERLFRSFPLFQSVPAIHETISTEDRTQTTKNIEPKKSASEEKKDTNIKKEEKKKDEKDKKNMLMPVVPKASDPVSSLGGGMSLGSTRLVPQLPLLVNAETKKIDPVLQKTVRQKNIPEFSETYVPVYRAKHLTDETLSQFSRQFSSTQNATDKLFVMGREVASQEGSQYEILVFDAKGEQHLGTFSSQNKIFPFRGVPVFQRVNPNVFHEISRFFVIPSSGTDISEILDDEGYLQSIFKSAYRHSLDAETRLGTNTQFGLDIYTLFPGIYVADRLR